MRGEQFINATSKKKQTLRSRDTATKLKYGETCASMQHSSNGITCAASRDTSIKLKYGDKADVRFNVTLKY